MAYDTNAFKHADSLKNWDSGRTQIKAAPESPRHYSGKDTRKWCKGKPGREHSAAWVYAELLWRHDLTAIFDPEKPRWGRNNPSVTLYCSTCQKHIKYSSKAEVEGKGFTILCKIPT